MKTKQELLDFISQIEFDEDGFPTNVLCKYDKLNNTSEFKEVVFINLVKFMTGEWLYKIKWNDNYE